MWLVNVWKNACTLPKERQNLVPCWGGSEVAYQEGQLNLQMAFATSSTLDGLTSPDPSEQVLPLSPAVRLPFSAFVV